MNAGELQDLLLANGWAKDRWGNFKKEFGGKTRRVKPQALGARFEVRSEELKEWIRVGGGYYKDLELRARDGLPCISNPAEKQIWRL
jgi:hypothetical protein